MVRLSKIGRIPQSAADTGTSMGNGETIGGRSSIRSEVADDTSQLAQDGRLPRAPQLVMVPSQGAGPVAIEIQPSQPQAAPRAQQARVAPTVQQPQATPNVQQSQVAPEVRQSRAAPAVQQAQVVQQPQAAGNTRQSEVPPEVRQSWADSNVQLAWIASDVRQAQAASAADQSQPEFPDPPVSTVTVHNIGHGSGRARTSLVTKFLGTAAVLSCGVVAAWALSSVLFPSAPKDEVPDQTLSMVAPAPEDVSAQREQEPPADNSQSTAPATQVEQATFVVANANQPQPQNDQQQPPSQAVDQQQPPSQAVNEQQQPQPQPRLSEQQTTSQQQVNNEQAQLPQPQQKGETSLSPAEVDRLTKLGEKMLGQGDLATARRVLEHAAQARGARAALLLGATYDPDGLRKMGVVGMRPDLEKAHMWYARAAEFGSTEASHRLAGLGQRGH
jgi:outer membrane biosynthesis protein TonB